MNPIKKTLFNGIFCGFLLATTAGAQVMVEDFENYPTDQDLQAAWIPGASTLSLSSYVGPGATGTNSMRIDVYMAANEWETVVIAGPTKPVPLTIGDNQYITLRVAGDPQFTNASWQQIYVYAFDSSGTKFGRWGASVPSLSTNWLVLNIPANTIQAPWNSPGLPNMQDIVRFDVYIYGQGSPAGMEYAATLYMDDLQVRDAPLIQFAPPSPMRGVIDTFEQYADDAALLGFYHYVNGSATTATTASLQTPAREGNKALKLNLDFGAGQWPWGSVYSPIVTPFSIPTNAVVSLWIKGDPTLAAVADEGTTFYISFYDAGGNAIQFTTPIEPVISSNWTRIEASYDAFWSTAVTDTGNLVQWRLLVEGWMGTADTPPLSATISIDDVKVTVTPVLAIQPDGNNLQLKMSNLMPGTTYTLRSSANMSTWTTTTIQATAATQTLPVPAGQKSAFFQLYYTP